MKKLLYTTMLIGSLALSGAANAQLVGTPISGGTIGEGTLLPSICVVNFGSNGAQLATQGYTLDSYSGFLAGQVAAHDVQLGSHIWKVTGSSINAVTQPQIVPINASTGYSFEFGYWNNPVSITFTLQNWHGVGAAPTVSFPGNFGMSGLIVTCTQQSAAGLVSQVLQSANGKLAQNHITLIQ